MKDKLNMLPVDRVEDISTEEFTKKYFDTHVPVVLKDFAKDWPATKKWSFDHFKNTYGNNVVKTYDSSFAIPGKDYMSAAKLYKFSDFVDVILSGDANLKMFLYNIKQECPRLIKDVIKPGLVKGFSDNFYFMFFAAKGHVTHLHIDIDMSHVFHTTFNGKKRFILISENESRNLYRQPFTVRSHIDPDNPDFEKYPKLKDVKNAWEVTIDDGETLFIPAGVWHSVYYEDSTFSLALRCRHQNLSKRLHGYYNLLVMQMIDRAANKLFGTKWFEWKDKRARLLAEES
jgi:Cupin-like domain